MNKEAREFIIDTLKKKNKLDINEIAKRADVSSRSVYRYLKSENQGITHRIEDEMTVQFILNCTDEEADKFIDLMAKEAE